MKLKPYHYLRCASEARGRSRLLAGAPWLILAMLLVAAITTPSAQAQFSGPGPGASTPLNPPVHITTDPAILYPASREVYFGRGDLLAIRLYASTDYTPTARIDLDGMIQLPLIGSVKLEGLTPQEAQTLIEQKLITAGMYRDPQVSIQIVESPNQVATVMGELHGVVPVIGQKRLYDVLASVGGGASPSATVVVGGGGSGLPPTASHVITIDRPGVAEPITIDLGTDPAKSKYANIPIFPRDTIIVPRVGVVYLLGAFKAQGAIPLQENAPMTLMKVAALAGGPGFEGRNNDLRIIRSEGLTRQVIRVNIRKVINGKEPDPVLQSEDIIFLPTSPMKAAIKSGGIGTLMGIASLLLFAAQR
ncbi:MAG: polysaccharide biosynthesis/export family protein [Edaphobacter sp.]